MSEPYKRLTVEEMALIIERVSGLGGADSNEIAQAIYDAMTGKGD